MELILASGSPRRRELLSMCGYEFTVIKSGAAEETRASEPEELVRALAEAKALGVFRSLPEERQKQAVVLGSDTVVVLDGTILGKPRDEAEAFAMLKAESGRENVVYTGVAAVRMDENGEETVSLCDHARVRFDRLSDEEILEYISTGDPMDKAGAYGIQGPFSVHITGIEGSYFTVVGLPVHTVYRLLAAFGIRPVPKKG